MVGILNKFGTAGFHWAIRMKAPHFDGPARNQFFSLIIWALFYVSLAAVCRPAHASMFTPPASVASKIRIDGKGFVLNGKRVFVVSGSLHYARVPRAMWAGRMEKMKRAGFNCLSTYLFWNYQEPRPGQFKFHGRHNIVAFVKLAQKMGFYVILRIGPWDCAEWDSGGYPVWLRFIPGLAVREGDPPYLAAMRQYYHKLLPMLVPEQITHGGPVIMVQLDNEDQQGWGAVLPNHYYKFLYHECMKFGIDVPLFFSGQHHGPNPAGNNPFNHAQHKSPWFTTEMWSGWFTQYGEYPAHSGERRMRMLAPWNVIANGGAGYNVYMAVGGSNFSHWNNQSNRASYDFGAPIGQGGNLRPSYFDYKFANYFGRSFSSVLADSHNVSGQYQKFAPGLNIAARRSPTGTLVFLRNFSGVMRSAVPKGGCKLIIPPARVVPVILNYKLNPEFNLKMVCCRTLGYFRQQPGLETLIVYGMPGSDGLLRIAAKGKGVVQATGGLLRSKAGTFIWHVKFAAGAPVIKSITVAGHRLDLVAMNTALARRTWIAKSGGRRCIVWGPDYLDHFMLTGHRALLRIERPLLQKQTSVKIGVLSGTGKPVIHVVDLPQVPLAAIAAPPLGHWQFRTADQPALTNFNTTQWLSCVNPRQMGADNYPGAYTWYRASFTVPKSGRYILELPGVRNYAEVFINGRLRLIGGGGFKYLQLSKGVKSLAVFAVNEGRSKMWGYIGPLRPIDKMGLFGVVKLKRQTVRRVNLTHWRGRISTSRAPDLIADVLSNQPGSKKNWHPIAPNSKLKFSGKAYMWLRAETGAIQADSLRCFLPRLPHGVMLFIDGHQLTLYANAKGILHTVMREGWRGGNQQNRIDLLVPIGPKPVPFTGTVAMVVKNRAPAFGKTGVITPWKMHGGIGPANPRTGWTPGDTATDVPTFYKTHFHIGALPDGMHRVLRVAVTGLGGGYVWINGHNLGRYPDPIMPLGVYIPSAWLRNGRNSMVIFDEQGHSPTQVHLSVYAAACRQRLTVAIPTAD